MNESPGGLVVSESIVNAGGDLQRLTGPDQVLAEVCENDVSSGSQGLSFFGVNDRSS